MTPTSHKLALVTENLHKATEWLAICADIAPWLSLTICPPQHPVEENAPTFEGNALLKAQAGLPSHQAVVIGEDTGVIIPALSGTNGLAEFPGLFSNRWFTPAWAQRLNLFDGDKTQARNAATLALMQGQTDRRAIYRCTLVALTPDKPDCPVVATGEWSLTVAHTAAGQGGFGYDPIMLTDDGQTVASLSEAEKNRISHRALAIKALLQQLYG
jgi:XTP/dITP diphosphohydrolase